MAQNMTPRLTCVLAVVCLAAGMCVLFLPPAHYFFGDSVSVLWGRPHSAGSLLRDFARLDSDFWFRPLSNSLPAFLLWPLFGTNFAGYHAVAILLHTALVVAVFFLFLRLLDDRLAAFCAAAFFGFHPIQFYATYDVAFYQEPITAGLCLAALVLLFQYARNGKSVFLAGGLASFALALLAKEIAVMVPALLALLLWKRPDVRKRAVFRALAGAGVMAAAFVLLYVTRLGVVFRYQPSYRPQWKSQAIIDLWHAANWAVVLPSGWQTQGWMPAASFHAACAVVVAGLVVLGVAGGCWRGAVWFLVAGAPALFTNHLLPHHLYLALLGVAYTVGGGVTWLRQPVGGGLTWLRRQNAHAVRQCAPGVASALLCLLCVCTFMDARRDAVASWVGRSCWEADAARSFLRASRLPLAPGRGLIVEAPNAPHLVFDWMGGRIFNLLVNDDIEAQLVEQFPPSPPAGFHLLRYEQHWIKEAGKRVSNVVIREPAAPVHLRIDPRVVRAGTDSYCLYIPELKGQNIDLKYSYNERPANVAYGFALLDKQGKTCVAVPASVPWGKVSVVAVRLAAGGNWMPAEAAIDILPPAMLHF